MKKKKLIIIITAVLVLLAGGFVLLYPSSMLNVELSGVDLANIGDGRHIGTFERGRFTNQVAVEIENGMIISISVVDGIFGPDVADKVFERVIAMQDTKIDVIVGSTATTNAYLKAIENALRP